MPTDPIPAEVRCPACGAVVRSACPLPAGERVSCRKCGEAFAVQHAQAGVQEASVLAMDEEEESQPAAAPPGRRVRRLPVPGSVRAAGIIWVVFGSLLLLSSIALAAVVLLGGLPGGLATFARYVGPVVAALALAFLYVGIRSIRGKARDLVGSSIGSFAFGALYVVSGVLQLGAGEPVAAGLSLVLGSGLVGAGVLALSGRARYKERRTAQAQSRRPRD
jgi:hypothetical protein